MKDPIESGYYWTVFKEQWVVAFYYEEGGYWHIPGTSLPLLSSVFADIIYNRLEEPK